MEILRRLLINGGGVYLLFLWWRDSFGPLSNEQELLLEPKLFLLSGGGVPSVEMGVTGVYLSFRLCLGFRPVEVACCPVRGPLRSPGRAAQGGPERPEVPHAQHPGLCIELVAMQCG